MITGAVKNKVDKIWTDIWAGGIANPLTVIEQLTYDTHFDIISYHKIAGFCLVGIYHSKLSSS